LSAPTDRSKKQDSSSTGGTNSAKAPRVGTSTAPQGSIRSYLGAPADTTSTGSTNSAKGPRMGSSSTGGTPGSFSFNPTLPNATATATTSAPTAAPSKKRKRVLREIDNEDEGDDDIFLW
jgi:hypothetical protein